jgi:transmembrane protein
MASPGQWGRNCVPVPIAAILDSRACWIAARLILTFVFWSAGIGQLVTFQSSVAQMAALNLTPGALFAIIVPTTLLIGSAMIVFNRWLWLGAGILGTFLVLTIPLVHPFWSMAGARADEEMRLVFEHITVIGGLMAIAIASRQHRLLRAAQQPGIQKIA